MLLNTQITLYKTVKTKDANGYDVKTETTQTVWAGEKSINRTEFYEAMRSGVSVQAIYDVRTETFADGFPYCRVANKSYKIIKAYKKPNGLTELTLAEV